MYKLLSYPMSKRMPLFANNPQMKIWPESSMENGDPYEQFFIETVNHNGTHIDAPRHFNPRGARIAELPIENFVFHHPVVIDLPKGKGELIKAADLEPLADSIANADLLLIRTGFGKIRDYDPHVYGNENPGFHPSAAEFFLENLPVLKAIGMDFPSATSALHISEGIAFHQIILGKNATDGRAILLIEDVNLNQDLSGLRRVYALPLLIEGIDSAPCTILGEF
ncbi:cyclase family protein [Desulfallas sp. Bu1-1]|uniref:cyclase family protein n=1 Tax=Desulfallas sp. Bu1-1 TaxID=2787620 RepID=UPI00189C8C91|nr:cyclase family protein [Desulfallas sp. Bu1-1]MBF7082775.1 cyclase family protein [Desulfallas sp. Bu1-1]